MTEPSSQCSGCKAMEERLAKLEAVVAGLREWHGKQLLRLETEGTYTIRIHPEPGPRCEIDSCPIGVSFGNHPPHRADMTEEEYIATRR